MPPDDKQPPEKPTVEIARPPDWAIALTEKVVTGFDKVEARLDTLESNLDLQGGSVLDIGKRITSVEERLGKVENSSLRPKLENESKVNLQQEAVIGTLLSDVATIKTDLKTNTTATVDTKAVVVAAASSFMKRNPKLEYAIVGFIIAVLSTGIALLNSLVHK